MKRRHLPAAILTGLAAAATGAGLPVAAQVDDDVPKREPSLAWEVPVNCDAAADLPGANPPRFCGVAVDGDAVFVHEYSRVDAEPSRFRLSAFDIATGTTQWSVAVGRTAQLGAYDEAVVLNDKSHIEVYDRATGELRFEADGKLAAVNRYGTLLMSDAASVTALDPRTGAELWQGGGDLGAWCRDIVILVAPSGGAPFAVYDHHTGEIRWRSEEEFDPAEESIACGFGPYVYTSDGTQTHEWDAFEGWLNWSVAVPDAGTIEIYREVVLVRSGPEAENIAAIDRETGQVVWTLPATDVGRSVSLVGRLRADATGVFTLHPFTGDIVNEVAAADMGEPFEIVGSSDTRVIVAAGSVVTTYGMNDLGVSWQLDLGDVPDDLGVSAGYLVVRTGSTLRGYS